jgi:hypothetical protein
MKGAESSKAYAAFCEYRNLGTSRSIEQVAKKCLRHRSLIARWCSKYNWVERAASYDEYLAERRRQRHQDKVENVTDDILDIAPEILKKELNKMLSDEAKPYATTERVTAIVNIIWKVLGLDKTKIDVSGEVKTTTDVTKLKQVLNTLPLEERIRLSEQLEELEDVGK